MIRRPAVLLALVAGVGLLDQQHAIAHAGLRFSNPVDGSTLGDTPVSVRLSFSEKPEPSLSLISVLDSSGASYHIGRPQAAADDQLTLSIPVRPLDRGIYVVNWRVISAVDGHASAGAYAFGVRVPPEATGAASITNPQVSLFEIVARWLLIVGLVVLLGSAFMQFAGARDFLPAVAGWATAAVGVALLAEARRHSASASLGALLSTSVGRALAWCAAALGAAGATIVLRYWATRNARPRIGRSAIAMCALFTVAAIAAHVASGHAAAAEGWQAATAIAAQLVHFGAAAVWIGGLAVLLIEVRGSPSAAKAAAVRRFSTLAAFCLILVVLTGIARTVGELTSWKDLIATGYGRAVLGKIVAVCAIAGFAAINRWRSVPAVGRNLRPLRLAGGAELALSAAAFAAAAVLGAMPPPSATAEPIGLVASGSDFGTTVRVRLTTPSNQPGPNRFVVRVSDYDNGTEMRAERVSLGFVPLDDPGVAPTSLGLTKRPDNSYAGSGANLAFAGRWRITVLVERSNDAVEVPLDVETSDLPQFVSILRPPGEPPSYTVEVKGIGHIRFTIDPAREGRSRVHVAAMSAIYEPQPIEEIVMTSAAGGDSARQLPIQRVNASEFAADLDVHPGTTRVTAVARTRDGARMRATIDVDVP